MSDKMTDAVLADIKAERARQNGMWGTEFDDRNTPNDWAAYIGIYVGKAVESIKSDEGGKRTLHFDREGFRSNMMKAAAIAVAAVEAFDRLDGEMAKRHYE